MQAESPYRMGQGVDIHRLVEGRPCILGGVQIEHSKGLLGHSDADALAHAIGDALLGAANLGDLGQHFPDTDPKWKNANSMELLKRIEQLLAEKGWGIVNVDAMVVAQAPRLAPHLAQMKSNIGEALKISSERVSVKATTSEQLGFTGREEGIAVWATAMIAAI